MVIELYYIKGISRIDTPYFATQALQRTYFNKKLVKSIDTAFYPPHYQNTIRLDTNDLEFTSSVNYLALQFNDKWYYYFIDNIDYNSEDVITLEITMDYIQTFMFNINFNTALIERKFINRWVNEDNSWKINRNYIRESISEANFVNVPKNYSSNPLWLVYKLSEYTNAHGNVDITYRGNIYSQSGSEGMISSYLYVFIPLNISKMIVKHEGTTVGTFDVRYGYVWEFLKKRSPYIVDSFYFRGMPFNEPGMKIEGDTLTVPDYCGTVYTHGVYEHVIVPLSDISASTTYRYALITSEDCNEVGALDSTTQPSICQYDLILYRDYKWLEQLDTQLVFSRSTSELNNFNTQYMPSLLDESYIRLEYGNDYCNVGYPLYKLTSISGELDLWLAREINITNGREIFWIKGYNDTMPIYSSISQDINVAFNDIIINSTNQWIIDNHSRLVSMAIQLGYNTTKYVGSGIAGSMGAMSTPLSEITHNPELRDYRYAPKKDDFHYSILPYRKQGKEMLSSAVSSIGSTTGSISPVSGLFSSIVNPGLAMQSEVVQAGMQPDTIKQTASSFDKHLTKSMEPWYRIIKVEDYNRCAQYYHRYGYMVNEYIQNVNLFEYVNTRFYFNILKLKEVSISLVDYINSNDIINGIENRLRDGIRLWNVLKHVSGSEYVTRDMCKYDKDNVEKDFL